MKTLPSLITTALAAALCSCATTGQRGFSGVEPQAEAIVSAMSDKLEEAETLRVTATRTATPGFNVGPALAENARITATRQKPDKLASVSRTNLGTREIRYDGKQLLLVDRAAKTHSVVPAPDTLDETVEHIHSTYGFIPPLGELLVGEPEEVMLEGVTSGKVVGTANIGGKLCDHLAFRQDWLEWELWVGQEDKLPYQLRMNYASGTGEPMVMTLNIQRWDLNASASISEFSTSPPSGSRALEMIPLN